MFGIIIKPWTEDSWTSMISNPFRHPDKAGHFVVHFGLTVLFSLGVSALVGFDVPLLAWLFDLWVNTQIEIMDATRPRRAIYRTWPVFFIDQAQYEEECIEGFSLKDWIAGIVGSVLAIWILA